MIMLAREGTMNLPNDEEFFAAISDSTDVILRAAGGQIATYRWLLQQHSQVFRAELSKFWSREDTAFHEENGKAVLDLDCSYETGKALFAYIESKGETVPGKSASPAMLKELACVASQWEVQPLLEIVDCVLATQMHDDVGSAFRKKEWASSGSHLRERSVQMLQLALKVKLQRLQRVAEHLIAENWFFHHDDIRVTKELETSSLCRIQRLAAGMHNIAFHRRPFELHSDPLQQDRGVIPRPPLPHQSSSPMSGALPAFPDTKQARARGHFRQPNSRPCLLSTSMERAYSKKHKTKS